MEAKTKIYKNIICLEVASSNGPKWWLQGYNVSYSPIPVSAIKQIAAGRLRQTNKHVFTTAIDIGGKATMVTINLQRSDVWAMIKKGLVPKDTKLPRTEPNYTQVPEKL